MAPVLRGESSRGERPRRRRRGGTAFRLCGPFGSPPQATPHAAQMAARVPVTRGAPQATRGKRALLKAASTAEARPMPASVQQARREGAGASDGSTK